MHKSDTIKIFWFSDFPKKSNGTFRELNFNKKSADENIDNAIEYLQMKKKELNKKYSKKSGDESIK